MKHPQLAILQDYFENELNAVQSDSVRDHLMNCDECSLLLSQIAKVDTHVKAGLRLEVTEGTKSRIFTDAQKILNEKKAKINQLAARKQSRDEWTQNLKDQLAGVVDEFRVPAYQLASLSLVIGFIVSHQQDSQTIVKRPLAGEVVVYTSLDSEGDHE